MKKILMYTNLKIFSEKQSGGMKRFLELYSYLKESSKNYKVDFYSRDNKNEAMKNRGIFLPKALSLFFKEKEIFSKIKKEKYDEIILFDVREAIWFSLRNIKNVNLFLRQDLIEYRKIMYREKNIFILYIYLMILYICEVICLINAKKIIIQCNYDLNKIIKRHFILSNLIKRKSRILINNVNPSWIVEKSKVIVKKDERNSTFKIGFIGNFSDKRKGHDLLLKVLKNLIENSYKIEGIIIGTGQELDKNIKLYEKYKNIKFLGHSKNPVKEIKLCDIVVVPSISDSCPNTVMEALYNNIPVIGSNNGGIPEILIKEEWRFNYEERELENIIIKYLNKDKLEIMKKEQLIRAKELTFNWGKKVEEILFEKEVSR